MSEKLEDVLEELIAGFDEEISITLGTKSPVKYKISSEDDKDEDASKKNEGDKKTGDKSDKKDEKEDNRKSEEPQGSRGTEEPEQDFDGESHAYNNIDIKPMGKPSKKEEKKTSSGTSGGGYKPPKHEKPKAPNLKAKNFMDLVNEWVFEIYGDIIDGAVDLVLEFLDFMLVFAHQPDTRSEEKTEKKARKKNIFDYGDAVIERYKKPVSEMKEFFDKAHAEILENVKREKAGMPTEWKICKKEPKFFKDIVELSKKAEHDPNSPEAKKWERFKNAPQIMDGLYNKEILLRKLSIGLSTIDVALDETGGGAVPAPVIKEGNEMAKLLENKKLSSDELKAKVTEKLGKITPHISDDTPVNRAIAEKVKKIERVINGVESDDKKFRGNLKKSIEALQEVNAKEIEIDDRSQRYYQDIRQNIDKIKEKYKDNPDQRRTAIHGYVSQLAEDLKKSHKSAEKYVTSINLAFRKKYKKEAQADFLGAQNAVNGYLVEGEAIGTMPTPYKETQNPFATGNQYAIFEAIRGFSR